MSDSLTASPPDEGRTAAPDSAAEYPVGLLAGAPIASFIVDSGGVIRWCNPAANALSMITGVGASLDAFLDDLASRGITTSAHRAVIDDDLTLVQVVDAVPHSPPRTPEQRHAFRSALLELHERSHQIADDDEFFSVLARRIVDVVPGADACRVIAGSPRNERHHAIGAATLEPIAAVDVPLGAPTLANMTEPVMVDGETVALIEIDSATSEYAFAPEAREMVTLLGRLVGDLIRRRRLETDLRAEREAFQHLAHHDALTGIANRREIEQRIGDAVTHAAQHGESVGILFVDVDDFKSVNDTHGHDIGDRVLVAVADTLRLAGRHDDAAGRWGGDEFVIVSPRVSSRVELRRIAQRILDGFGRGLPLDNGTPIACSLSIGAAWARGQQASADQLLANAEEALRRAKVGGKNRVGIDAP